jgi:autotransporter-associated beta strand protein
MTGSQAFTFDNGGQFAVKATNSVGHSINADIEFGTAAVTSTLNFVNFSFESSLLVTGDIHSESAGRVVFFGISSDLSGTRISGSISGPLSLEVSSGRAILSGHNTYTGETFVAGGKLTLGASNVLSDISPVVLSVGTLATGGFSDTVGTLQLSYDSTIDFGTGSSALTFADSSAIPWTGTLSLTNFDIGTDVLKFGSTSTALTPAQLSQISLPGYQAGLESDGTVSFVAVPEPSTNLLCALAGFLGIVGTATSRIGSRAGI